MPDMSPLILIIIVVVIYLLSSIKILAEYERGVIFPAWVVFSINRRVPASSWSSSPSTAWFVSRCAWKPWRCRRRTWSRAITSPSR